MPYQTTEEAVEAAAEFFATAENRLRANRHGMRTIVKDMLDRVNQDGHIGGIMKAALQAEADAIATRAVADIYAFHSKLTEIAKAKGIDLPAVADGGGR